MHISTAPLTPKPFPAALLGARAQLNLDFGVPPLGCPLVPPSRPKPTPTRRPVMDAAEDDDLVVQRSLPLCPVPSAEEVEAWIEGHWATVKSSMRYVASMSRRVLGELLAWLLDSDDDGPFCSAIALRLDQPTCDLDAARLMIVREIVRRAGADRTLDALCDACRRRPWLAAESSGLLKEAVLLCHRWTQR